MLDIKLKVLKMLTKMFTKTTGRMTGMCYFLSSTAFKCRLSTYKCTLGSSEKYVLTQNVI